ncbi:hypothetical protein BGZ60DRAFT_423691 [Tricladium varicosporioides]|nr:hypothetical protein BGZ60DRAFT_423691 [Hymenoscyphus varicosporioides]
MFMDLFSASMSLIDLVKIVCLIDSQGKEWQEHEDFILSVSDLFSDISIDRQRLSHRRTEDDWGMIDRELAKTERILARAKTYVRWREGDLTCNQQRLRKGSIVAFMLRHKAVMSNKHNLIRQQKKLEEIRSDLVQENEKMRQWEEFLREKKEELSRALAAQYVNYTAMHADRKRTS